ncbi:MAG: hypothetical protein IPP42_23085 [Saprospiraceae bacterium]|nr:hypothetical protein [Saprospiraceae bacterium]
MASEWIRLRSPAQKLMAPPAAPDLAAAKWGQPIQLFNGKDLTGWKLINEKQKMDFMPKRGILGTNPAQVEDRNISATAIFARSRNLKTLI